VAILSIALMKAAVLSPGILESALHVLQICWYAETIVPSRHELTAVSHVLCENLSPISCEYAKAVKFGPLYFSPDFIGQNEHGQI
jgi:hypothetical protein